MSKRPRIDYIIKANAADEVAIEAFRRETEPAGLMATLQKRLVHQNVRKKRNA